MTKNLYRTAVLVILAPLLCAPGQAGSAGKTPPLASAPPVNGADSREKGYKTEEPLPSSVIVKRDHTIVRLAPTNRAKRRGVAMKGSRLPVSSSDKGPGCKGPWYEVHSKGWLCHEDVTPSALPPEAKEHPIVPDGEIVPWQYGFVREPTIEYRMVDGDLVESREVLDGFGFGIKSRFQVNDERFFRTAEDTLISRAAAGMTDRISRFQGLGLNGGKPWPVGFVNAKNAYAYDSPLKSKKNRLGPVERYRTFEALEVVGKGKRRFVRFDEKAYLSLSDVRIASSAPPPKGIAPNERWVDVDTTEQIITAYEGEFPVYATMISSGRYGGSSTVKGEFRIWAKVAAIAMDNTDEELEDASLPEASVEGDLEKVDKERKLYSLHDVPWTQFFHESYALHGVYWHDRFGNRRSHGCVNLSPADAKWFYRFTSPKVPDGWWAIYSQDTDPGTLVRIR